MIAAIALLVGLGLYEGLRRIPSRSDAPGAQAEVTVRGLCRALSMTYEIGIVRGRDDDVATGDRAFDGQFLVRGPEDLALAVFDADTRLMLVALTVEPFELRDLTLEDGVLTAVPTRRLGAREKAVLTRRLGRLAKHLRDPGRVARRLAEAWHREGHRDARRLQLAALARHHASHPDTRAAVREAATDADPELRLIAAIALGPAGGAVLRDLAFDAAADAAVAARAITALGEGFTAADAAALLTAILGILEEPGGQAARHRVALACIAVLGVSGSVDAVGLLLDVAERHGDPLGRAARAAVAAIQSRAPGARGELSLPESAAGEVSLAAEGGEVSLAPPTGPSD